MQYEIIRFKTKYSYTKTPKLFPSLWKAKGKSVTVQHKLEFQFVLDNYLLAHLNWKLMLAFRITLSLLSVCPWFFTSLEPQDKLQSHLKLILEWRESKFLQMLQERTNIGLEYLKLFFSRTTRSGNSNLQESFLTIMVPRSRVAPQWDIKVLHANLWEYL